jgi:CSLREA domain-containing protein
MMVYAKQHYGITQWGWLAGVMGLVLALAGVPPAAAAVFTVNSTADRADVELGDGICDADASPDIRQCTLRAAVQEANRTDQADVIGFRSGLGTISVTDAIGISQSLTIRGRSDSRQRINGGQSASRIFNVSEGIVHFENLIIVSGNAGPSGGCISIASTTDAVVMLQVDFLHCASRSGNGGAIVTSVDPLRILGGTFLNAADNDGGAIFTRNNGKTVVRNALFRENTAQNDGGAMANASHGDQDIKGARFEGNSAGDSGGALAHQGRTNSHTKVTESVFADNVADFGGAMCDVTGAGLFEAPGNTDGGGNFAIADPIFQNFFCFAP